MRQLLIAVCLPILAVSAAAGTEVETRSVNNGNVVLEGVPESSLLEDPSAG